MFGDSSLDLEITCFLILISFFVSVFLFYKSRKIFLSLFAFSLSSNISVYLTISTGTRMFILYDLLWLVDFTLEIWPLINLALLAVVVILHFKNKKMLKK